MASFALVRKIVMLSSAIAITTTPIAASAQTAAINAAQVDPMVAFSMLGSADSRTALCGRTSERMAATMQEQGNSGCVLPMRDVAPLAEVPGIPAHGFGLSPILLLAAGGALLFAILLLRGDGDGHIDIPRPPISPA
nr:hypothetical protein [uncultured Sphingomonas sp.]